MTRPPSETRGVLITTVTDVPTLQRAVIEARLEREEMRLAARRVVRDGRSYDPHTRLADAIRHLDEVSRVEGEVDDLDDGGNDD